MQGGGGLGVCKMTNVQKVWVELTVAIFGPVLLAVIFSWLIRLLGLLWGAAVPAALIVVPALSVTVLNTRESLREARRKGAGNDLS